MKRETLFYERAGGRYEAWIYTDGRSMRLLEVKDLNAVIAYAKKHNYQLQYAC